MDVPDPPTGESSSSSISNPQEGKPAHGDGPRRLGLHGDQLIRWGKVAGAITAALALVALIVGYASTVVGWLSGGPTSAAVDSVLVGQTNGSDMIAIAYTNKSAAADTIDRVLIAHEASQDSSSCHASSYVIALADEVEVDSVDNVDAVQLSYTEGSGSPASFPATAAVTTVSCSQIISYLDIPLALPVEPNHSTLLEISIPERFEVQYANGYGPSVMLTPEDEVESLDWDDHGLLFLDGSTPYFDAEHVELLVVIHTASGECEYRSAVLEDRRVRSVDEPVTFNIESICRDVSDGIPRLVLSND